MRRLLITALAVPLALAGCSEEAPVATDDDIARIEQSLIRGSELSWELLEAESRVASLCMQDEDFTVHDPIRLFGNGIPHRFTGFDSAYTRIPTVEQAELFGFGMFTRFTDTDAAVEMRENPEYLAYMAEEDGWWNPQWDEDHEEFEAMGEEYRDDWLEAFLGPEGFAAHQEMQDMDAEELMEADLAQAPPGGCELQTIEVVYGGIREDEDEETGEVFWSKPDVETPLTEIGEEGFKAEFAADHVDQQDDFLICVDERGYGEWDFDEWGALPVWDYLNLVYGETSGMESDPEVVPELTDEAEDTDDPVAYEFAMALDFAECAESAGLRGDIEDEWARKFVDPLLERETELYAWEEGIEEYLANAQDYLAG